MSIKREPMDGHSDSRKRPLDSDGDDGMTKRSNQGHVDPTTRDDVHLKLMVPSCAAGAVIGKGGETIGKLQRETGAKMKMSKNQDTFPGTSERICLVVGTVHACHQAHEEIAVIISDKPDPQPKPNSDGDGKINYQRHQQTKFVIPNSSAGVIIGKGGAYIKELKERSGAHVNVSHKSDNPERIVTVSGDASEIRSAMSMILDKLATDPQSSSYPSLNYAAMSHGGGGMSTPSGSFTNLSGNTGGGGGFNLGNMSGGGAMTPQQVQQAAQSLSTMMRSFNNLGSGINNLNIGTRPRNPVLEQLVQTLKLTGYTDSAADEIATALSTLANYGVLNLTGGSLLGNLMSLNRLNQTGSSSSAANGNQSSVPSLLGSGSAQGSRMGGDQSLSSFNANASSTDEDGASLLRQLTQTLARTQAKAGGGDVYGPVGGMKDSPEGAMNNMFPNNSSLFGSDSAAGFGGFTGGQGQQGSTSPEPTENQEIEVAENLAGAIIGQQGRGITEIQHITGANVSVSRRGVYAPGTQNRIVTITGPASGVGRAALLVRQKIQDAEQRRAQNAY